MQVVHADLVLKNIISIYLAPVFVQLAENRANLTGFQHENWARQTTSLSFQPSFSASFVCWREEGWSQLHFWWWWRAVLANRKNRPIFGPLCLTVTSSEFIFLYSLYTWMFIIYNKVSGKKQQKGEWPKNMGQLVKPTLIMERREYSIEWKSFTPYFLTKQTKGHWSLVIQYLLLWNESWRTL